MLLVKDEARRVKKLPSEPAEATFAQRAEEVDKAERSLELTKHCLKTLRSKEIGSHISNIRQLITKVEKFKGVFESCLANYQAANR